MTRAAVQFERKCWWVFHHFAFVIIFNWVFDVIAAHARIIVERICFHIVQLAWCVQWGVRFNDICGSSWYLWWKRETETKWEIGENYQIKALDAWKLFRKLFWGGKLTRLETNALLQIPSNDEVLMMWSNVSYPFFQSYNCRWRSNVRPAYFSGLVITGWSPDFLDLKNLLKTFQALSFFVHLR